MYLCDIDQQEEIFNLLPKDETCVMIQDCHFDKDYVDRLIPFLKEHGIIDLTISVCNMNFYTKNHFMSRLGELTSLESVRLDGMIMDDNLCCIMVDSFLEGNTPREIDLTDNYLRFMGRNMLKKLVKTEKLETLVLDDNSAFGNFSLLVVLEHAQCLCSLSITDTGIDNLGLSYIADFLENKPNNRLDHLNIAGLKPSKDTLSNIVRFGNLKYLDLCNTGLTDEHVVAIQEAGKMIPRINFEWNPGISSVLPICDLVQNGLCHNLRISGVRLTQEDVNCITEMILNPQVIIEELSLTMTGIYDKDLDSISQGIHLHPELHSIIVNTNLLEICPLFMKAIKGHPELTNISTGGTWLPEDEIKQQLKINLSFKSSILLTVAWTKMFSPVSFIGQLPKELVFRIGDCLTI